MRRGIDRGAVLIGLLFVAVGFLYELDSLQILDIQPSYIWPLVLIGLGVAVLLGGGRRRRRFPPIEPFEPSDLEHPTRADEPWTSKEQMNGEETRPTEAKEGENQ